MPAGCFLQAGGMEGWAEDLARSTAEGVGGFFTEQLFVPDRKTLMLLFCKTMPNMR